MIIRMQSFSQDEFCDTVNGCIAILGVASDERAHMAQETLKRRSVRTVTVEYLPDEVALRIDGKIVEIDNLASTIGIDEGLVVADATTLGVAELVVVIKELLGSGVGEFHICYLEPEKYSRPRVSQRLEKRDFELTEERRPFSSVPPHFYVLDEKTSRCVFLAGFEGERFAQAIDENPVNPRGLSIVFGVPAYRAGWEMDAFANHVRFIREAGMGSRVFFSPADNPQAAFEVMEQIFSSLNKGERMFIAPFGTKPQAVGVALFLARNPEVGLVFDHPVRSPHMSEGTGKWHRFGVKMV